MRCRNCKKKFEKEEAVYQGCYYYCSKKCRLDNQRQQKRKEKEKIKLKKAKKIDKKRNSISYLSKQADKLWSEVVKMEYNHECQYCGKKEYLNSHHLFTRSRKATRWDLDNGICLCSGCHTLSSKFSFHQTPYEATERIIGIKGEDFMNKLKKKSQTVIKVTPDYIKEQMSILKEYRKIININN